MGLPKNQKILVQFFCVSRFDLSTTFWFLISFNGIMCFTESRLNKVKIRKIMKCLTIKRNKIRREFIMPFNLKPFDPDSTNQNSLCVCNNNCHMHTKKDVCPSFFPQLFFVNLSFSGAHFWKPRKLFSSTSTFLSVGVDIDPTRDYTNRTNVT